MRYDVLCAFCRVCVQSQPRALLIVCGKQYHACVYFVQAYSWGAPDAVDALTSLVWVPLPMATAVDCLGLVIEQRPRVAATVVRNLLQRLDTEVTEWPVVYVCVRAVTVPGLTHAPCC